MNSLLNEYFFCRIFSIRFRSPGLCSIDSGKIVSRYVLRKFSAIFESMSISVSCLKCVLFNRTIADSGGCM